MNHSKRNTLACLVLAAAVAACQTAPYGAGIALGEASSAMDARDLAFVADAIATGRDARWEARGMAYSLEVVRTYQEGGTTCRDYQLTGVDQAEHRTEVRNHACRAGDGRWRS
jgi:surface antigen